MKTKIAVNITLDMESTMGELCAEHIQISTAFKDYYDFYVLSGARTIQLEFTDLKDVIDIHKSGLRFFSYCTDTATLLSSSLMTSLLWTGGQGTSRYLPIFGSRPTNYQ